MKVRGHSSMETKFIERRLAQLVAEYYATPEGDEEQRDRAWDLILASVSPLIWEINYWVTVAAKTTPAERPEVYACVRRLANALGGIHRQPGVFWIDLRAEELLEAMRSDDALSFGAEAWHTV